MKKEENEEIPVTTVTVCLRLSLSQARMLHSASFGASGGKSGWVASVVVKELDKFEANGFV